MAKAGDLIAGNKLTGFTFNSLKKHSGKQGYPYKTFTSLAEAGKQGYNTVRKGIGV